MKNNNLFSYQPKNSNEKIWQIYPDPKSEFVVLEIRTVKENKLGKENTQKNSSQLLILDSQKKEIVGTAEMEATQTLVNFFDKTILLSEIDFQNEMPIAKGLQALNMYFEIIWQLEEVSYYGIIEEENQTQNENKVVFSLQSNYYSLPLKLESNLDKEEIEAKEENYSNLQSKVKQYFYSTNEYPTNHINYTAISDFIFEKTNHKVENLILYTENSTYLICSYVVENQKQKNENYLLSTDKQGNLKSHFLIRENIKNPQEIILMQNKILWIDKNECFVLSI
jgi:hypothetical protein